jgi:hypothetical protein
MPLRSALSSTPARHLSVFIWLTVALGGPHPHRDGEIHLTVTAECGLQSLELQADALDELRQLQKVGHPERRPPAGHGDKDVRLGSIRPTHGQRTLNAILVEKEDTVLAPRLAYPGEDEPSPAQGMERMGYENSSVWIVVMMSS